MKRIVPRCLLAMALGVGAPMPLLWLMEATAQDQPAAKASQDLIFKVQEAPRWLESKKTHIRWTARAEGDEDREAHLRELLSNYRRTDDEKGRSRVVEELTKVVSDQFDGASAAAKASSRKWKSTCRSCGSCTSGAPRRKTRSSATECASFSATLTDSAGAMTTVSDDLTSTGPIRGGLLARKRRRTDVSCQHSAFVTFPRLQSRLYWPILRSWTSKVSTALGPIGPPGRGFSP